MNRSWLFPCSIAFVGLLLVLCICVGIGAAAGYISIRDFPIQGWNLPFHIGIGTPTTTPYVFRPVLRPSVAPTPVSTAFQPEATITLGVVPTQTQEATPTEAGVPTDTLEIIAKSDVPVNDLIDLARRLKGITDIPRTLPPLSVPFKVGDQQTFWVSNVDTNANFQVNATLRYITRHTYFWIENRVNFNQTQLRDLAETFEKKIYPTDREFFGSEWTPGVDDDPHLYILLARGLGKALAGYFSSADEYPPQAHKYSNGHEMFLLNADNLGLNQEFTYGVLAHEFQHMIHWNRDRNETAWMNEGFSQLAMFLNGYDIGGFDVLYSRDPDVQLNDWPNDSTATAPHYGASFLFLTYFLDRFGEGTTKALVADPENGLESIDQILRVTGEKDPQTGKPIGADDVYIDWAIASIVQDKSLGDGRYTYTNYPAAPKPQVTETISSCPTDNLTRSVHEYGVDYIQITCQGDFTLHFEGSTVVPVLPENPHSGSYMFWSNKGDESDMTLTRTFDFTGQTGPLVFSYWTWYDLEKDYDYLYLEASTGDDRWEILTTPSGTPDDLSGNSYGWGYNGKSGNGPQWVQEKVDLSKFAGKKVQLRFEYVTDAAINGEGLLLDDLQIPAIGYSSGFETDNGGWDAQGFVRIQNILPQVYRLALITHDSKTTVQYIPINPDITADIPLHIGGDVKDVILVVTGTTRYTRQTTGYRIAILR